MAFKMDKLYIVSSPSLREYVSDFPVVVQTQHPPAPGAAGSSSSSTGTSSNPASAQNTGSLSLGQPPQPSSQPQQHQQQIPTNLASGTGAYNPFAGITGARYAGQMALPNASMFGPDGILLHPSSTW